MQKGLNRSLAGASLRILASCILVFISSISSAWHVHASTTISGSIETDTTWVLTQSPYLVTGDVLVEEGVTLTIEPGVEVRFQPGTGLLVAGILIAEGDPGMAIKFTSSSTAASAGDWKGIEFTASATGTTLDLSGDYLSGSLLQHCVVEYAGAGGNYAVRAKSLMIDSCSVLDNAAGGIYDPGTATDSSRISNNKLFRSGMVAGNGGAIYTIFADVENNQIDTATASGSGAGIYADGSDVLNNTILNCDSNGSGGGLYARYSLVSDNLFQENEAMNGGGVYSVGSIVQDNIILGNQAVSGGGLQASESDVIQNVISYNSATLFGGGIYAIFSTMSGNTVAHNAGSTSSSRGAGAFVDGDQPVDDNSIVGNFASLGSKSGGMEIIGSPVLRGNNIYGNLPFDVKLTTDNDVDGIQNYWGTSEIGDIPDQIFDKNDDGNLAYFSYSPILSQLSDSAPLPPPLGVNITFTDGSGMLSWEPVPGTSGINYSVYYDLDSFFPPFDGSGLNQGSSPIDAGTAAELLLDGFDVGEGYYLAVRAADPAEQESWYSNIIYEEYGEKTFLPMIINVIN